MFWERFVKECERKGLKPNPAGKEIVVSSATITKWSQGVIPRGENLNKVASYFGVTSDYLLGNTDERTVKSDLERLSPPLSAYPNPLLYGERYSFKQEDTPYRKMVGSVFFLLLVN